MSKEKIEFEIGSGNVFKDLGFPNPEEELMKVRFAAIIYNTDIYHNSSDINVYQCFLGICS